jgi:hypothetical protein
MAGLDTTIRNSSRLSPSEKTLGERREEFRMDITAVTT